MYRILVTGGAGFLGSHVADQLVGAGHRVVVLDDLTGGREGHLPAGAEFVRGNILDTELLACLFARHSFDFVFHLAAFAAEGLSHFLKRFTYATNVVGSAGLINEAVKHRVRAFVFASSIAVYGLLPAPVHEEMAPRPEDPYGISKWAVEQDLTATGRVFGLPSIILRLHNVYGDRQDVSDRYRNVVGIFMRQALQGEEMTVLGDGEQTRAFTHVSDVAPWVARCIDVPVAYDQVINLGSDEVTSVLELSRLVAEVVGVPWRVRREEPRREVKHAFADHRRARALLGFAPLTPLREGLARTAAWLRQHGLPPERPSPQLELQVGLPWLWAAPDRRHIMDRG
jgi:UDP-glucose 4-epimerase